MPPLHLFRRQRRAPLAGRPVLLAAVLALAGCPDNGSTDGPAECGGDVTCPEGMVCGMDNLCHPQPPDFKVLPDLTLLPDLVPDSRHDLAHPDFKMLPDL